MADLERIESEIRSLSGGEFSRFRVWFEEYDWNTWDRQLENDVTEGKLDSLADAALSEHEAGRHFISRKWPGFGPHASEQTTGLWPWSRGMIWFGSGSASIRLTGKTVGWPLDGQ